MISESEATSFCFCFFIGEKVKLSLAAEEVAFFFAQMLDHEYTTKKVFRENFFKDWRKVKPKGNIEFGISCLQV